MLVIDREVTSPTRVNLDLRDAVLSLPIVRGYRPTSTFGRAITRFAGALLAFFVVGTSGCSHLTETPSDAATRTSATVKPSAQEEKQEPSKSTADSSETPSPVRDALTLLFAREAQSKDSPFPKGTHLLGVSIKGKQALVDMSKEFNGLQNRGESYEGLAQRKMCKVLAPFDNLETMHVTVDGKEYESQAAEWNNIPIRVQNENATGHTDNRSVGKPGNSGDTARHGDREASEDRNGAKVPGSDNR